MSDTSEIKAELIGLADARQQTYPSGGGEMGELIRATDWSSTSIGPVETWSQSLRMMVSFLLANRFPLLLWWGPEYVSIYNDAYRPILGSKHPRSMGQPVRECWSEIWHILQPLIDTPFNGGPATWMDDIALEINRDGFIEETHFTIAYSPVPDETAPRGIGGVLATVHEITEKVVAERRVAALRDLGSRAAEAKTAKEACAIAAKVFSNYPKDVSFTLLYLIDTDGRRARLSAATEGCVGEAVSPLVVELFEDAVDRSVWPLAEAVRSEAMVILEDLSARLASVPHGPRSDPPTRAVVVPIRATMAHQLAGLLVAGVSPRLRLDEQYRSFFELAAAQIATAISYAGAYEEERKRAEALAEIDRAKTAFFSNVSHEFRTPLTLMLGPLEDALASPGLGAPDRERLEVAHRNSLRLLKLVNSLLDFSRIEAGRAEAVYEPVDLAALTTDLASTFRSACERAELTLLIDCPKLPEPVYVDRDMWEKIVLNLLSNAFKFTFQGEIAVDLRAIGGYAELSVHDTGVGVPEHELPRLFERFHRVQGQKSRTHEGSGIGLALVQELVKLHNGTIATESQEDQGTRFTIALPFGTAHLPAERIGAEHDLGSTSVRAEAYVQEALRWLPGEAAAAGGTASSGYIPALRGGARVLLADDNADMRAYVRRLLEPGCIVQTVADGQAALEATREHRPDLVLADVMMPRLDGFELLRTIRSDPALRDLPVIMLSARAGEEARVEGLAAGADDYLTKPFSARELIARIGATLELARVRRDAFTALREAEQRTRALFQQAPGFVCVLLGPEHVFEFANIAYRRLVGGRDLLGQPVRAVLPEVERQGFFEVLDRVYRTGEPFSGLETPLQLQRQPDGPMDLLFIDFIYQPITDATGEITGIFVEGFDVTDRVTAQAALRESEARYRTLFDSIDEAFCIIEAVPVAEGEPTDWRYVAANPALEAQSGIKNVVGRTIRDAIPTEAEWWIETFDALLRSGEPIRFERDLVSQGRVLDLYAFRIEDGTRRRVGVIFQDISERKRTEAALRSSEEALRRLNEQLESRVAEEVAAREQVQERLAHAQRMEALGQLAGGIAHDFNNVLQAVTGGLGLIEKRAEDVEAVRRMARMASEAAGRGAAVTSRLLAFARRGELRAVPLQPMPLLENLREILTVTLGPGISVRIEAPPDMPALFADKAQLETVLVNLAVNARDAMPDGGSLIISIKPESVAKSRTHPAGLKPGRYLRIELTDTGIGMNDTILARAAEPFFTTKPAGQGTGLGLAMVRGFAQQSGGGFAIRSAPDGGTTVTLWFPQARDGSGAAGSEQRRVAILSGDAPPRVLVVDDDAIVREVLARHMEELGCQITEAPDGPAALAQLDAGEAVDLLLTDLSMPGLDGVRLIEAARRRLPRLPALLLTGNADEGVNDIQDLITTLVRKPVSGDALAEHVAALLRRQSRLPILAPSIEPS